MCHAIFPRKLRIVAIWANIAKNRAISIGTPPCSGGGRANGSAGNLIVPHCSYGNRIDYGKSCSGGKIGLLKGSVEQLSNLDKGNQMKTLSSIINSIDDDVKACIGLTIAIFSICGLALAFQLSQLAVVLRLAVPVFLCLPPSMAIGFWAFDAMVRRSGCLGAGDLRLDDPDDLDDLDDLFYDVPSACWMLLSFMVGVAAFAASAVAIAFPLSALLCAILG